VEDAVDVVRYPAIDAPLGIVTVPVKVGEASGAYVLAADAVERYPGTTGVPVKVGLASGA
jgi:hypothetical protein